MVFYGASCVLLPGMKQKNPLLLSNVRSSPRAGAENKHERRVSFPLLCFLILGAGGGELFFLVGSGAISRPPEALGRRRYTARGRCGGKTSRLFPVLSRSQAVYPAADAHKQIHLVTSQPASAKKTPQRQHEPLRVFLREKINADESRFENLEQAFHFFQTGRRRIIAYPQACVAGKLPGQARP